MNINEYIETKNGEVVNFNDLSEDKIKEYTIAMAKYLIDTYKEGN